jgi:CheY-like chemotaxis protein
VSSAAESHRSPLNILVVDDQLDGAEMVADFLATYGHATRVATLGYEALRLIEEQKPDVLVLDLSLPELDGYEIARLMRSLFGDDIRLVALTGFDTQKARELAQWAGFDAFVAKPFRPSDMETALRPIES